MAQTSEAGRPLLGIAIALVTVFLFALSDVLSKSLVTRYPVPVVIAMRYVTSLAILLAFVWPRIGRRLWQVNQRTRVAARGAVLAFASLTMGLALQRLPVGETIAILYLSPFAVMALAVPLFGEKVSPFGWFLAVLGFSGALLILRPGGTLDGLGVAFALVNAACATVFHLLTRGLSRTESAIAMLFYVSLIGATVFSISAIPYLGDLQASARDVGAMVLLGALATGGHFLFALSYREAEASVIAPVNYFHLFWGAILGFIVFHHVPDRLTLFGMALVFCSGVGVAVLAHFNQTRHRAAMH